MSNATKTRVDIRLAKKQKEYFEYAANLGGFKTLTDFVIFSGEQQANQIVEKHNTILASKKDQEVFFDAPGDSRSLEYPSILLITPYVDKIINNDFGFALH